MNGIFSWDSPLMKLLSRLGDWIALNVLFVISCIPVITIGAACTALYDSIERIQQNEGFDWKSYWKAFRRDFKKSTILWLLQALISALVGYALVFYIKSDASIGGVGRIVCIIVGIIWLLASAWVFPIHAKYDNTPRQTVKNALLCGIMFLPQSVIGAFFNAVPFAVGLFFPKIFGMMGVVWFMLWFSVSGTVIHRYFQKPFAKLEAAQQPPNQNP